MCVLLLLLPPHPWHSQQQAEQLAVLFTGYRLIVATAQEVAMACREFLERQGAGLVDEAAVADEVAGVVEMHGLGLGGRAVFGCKHHLGCQASFMHLDTGR